MISRRLTSLFMLCTSLGATAPVSAQECGYFAILGCFRDPQTAFDWNEKIEFGKVVHTSSNQYPSFRPGYFCVVHGPTNNADAERVKRAWRDVVHDAYVKNSC